MHVGPVGCDTWGRASYADPYEQGCFTLKDGLLWPFAADFGGGHFARVKRSPETVQVRRT